jgi:hypothetical protein
MNNEDYDDYDDYDDDYTDEDRWELESEVFLRMLIEELRPHFTN